VFRNKLEQYVPEELNKLFEPTTEEEIKIGEAGTRALPTQTL
jgi:hypothetical protein